MKKVVADAGQVDALKRTDLAKEGFEKALANMRELAEMASKSQREAFEVVRKRIEENVEDIRNLGKNPQMNCFPGRCRDPLVQTTRLPE